MRLVPIDVQCVDCGVTVQILTSYTKGVRCPTCRRARQNARMRDYFKRMSKKVWTTRVCRICGVRRVLDTDRLCAECRGISDYPDGITPRKLVLSTGQCRQCGRSGKALANGRCEDCRFYGIGDVDEKRSRAGKQGGGAFRFGAVNRNTRN